MIFLIVVAVIVATYFWNKKRAFISFAAYYAKKRQEFPWLDKWIKDHVDPTKSRAAFTAGTNVGMAVIIVAVIAGVGFVIQFIAGGGSAKRTVIMLVFTAIGLVLSELYARKQAKNPGTTDDEDYGLTLECPQCGCPHSWVLIEERNTVASTDKTTWSDIHTNRVESVKVVYEGTTIRDFKCLNCNHTEHLVFENRRWEKYKPEEHTVFTPPKSAWELPSDITGKAADKLYEQVKAAQTNTAANTTTTAAVKKDYAANISALQQAAQMGSRDAMYDLGYAYLLGSGVEQDQDKAKMWLEKAWFVEETEDFELGWTIYEEAKSAGEAHDNDRAIALFQKALETYDAKSQWWAKDAIEKLEALKKLK
jgi:hypothetical protein